MNQRKAGIKVSGLIASGRVREQAEGSVVSFDAHSSAQSALLRSDGDQGDDNRVIELACDLIDDSPYQSPSRQYDPEKLDELGGSMTAAGQAEPIQVRRKGNRYELIAGHRRIRAARIRGWARIKTIVVLMDDQQAELATLTHNEGRKDLSDFERGKAYQYAIERGHGKQAQIALLFATSVPNVSRCLALLKLPVPIVALLETQPGLFGIKTAEIINQLLSDYPDEEALVVQAVERLKDGATGSSIKGWFEQMHKQKARSTATPGNRPKVITNKSGRQLFTAKRDGRVITVRISASDVDPEATMSRVIESLKIYTDENFEEK